MGIIHDLTPATTAAAAAAIYTDSRQDVQPTEEGRDEMEDLEHTGSCFPGLCILHLQVKPRWLLFDYHSLLASLLLPSGCRILLRDRIPCYMGTESWA